MRSAASSPGFWTLVSLTPGAYSTRDEVKYSWWSYRFHAREKNVGWRLDYFLVSDSLRDKIAATEIHTEILGSDHCPVELDLDL